MFKDLLNNAIDTILHLGTGCVLSKSDLQHAYKIIPLYSSETPKLGLFWEPGYWKDLTLPMGCRMSAKIFETFTTALKWILKNKIQTELHTSYFR